METLNISFNIKGRWDGDRNGSGLMTTNGVQVPVSAPAGLAGPGIGSSPEELLVTSAATCYIITLASILRKREINYSPLEINSEAIVQKEGNTLTFKEIIHRPVIILNDGNEEKKKMVEQLAQRAEKACFIGRTLKPGVTISVQPEIRFA
ncbi:OsmC family protein [Candidatus Clostridium stratigraminis]|uniref:OsmC family protein n=1 Tax=Candidatus Clostridium stratigraminis TaxID=3381661 RepID=A0ABW8SYS6_9CLOT